MIQNPPSSFILWLFLLYKYLRGAVVVVDCHNYGYTIARTNGWPSWICKALAQLEFMQMRRADIILTVSRGMKEDLKARFGPQHAPLIRTFYDVPANRIRLSRKQAEEYLAKYYPSLSPKRVRLITATSYTDDEEISWLIAAAVQLARTKCAVELIITGRGPNFDSVKKLLQQAIKECPEFSGTQIFTSHEDYLPVLASADIGVCLHNSSSGVDLPMKLVDMKAAGIQTILALDYEVIHEVIPRESCFSNQEELTQK